MGKCKNKDCNTRGRYGYKNGPGEYCRIHKLDDMINLSGYICHHNKCIKRVAFAYKKSDKKNTVT